MFDERLVPADIKAEVLLKPRCKSNSSGADPFVGFIKRFINMSKPGPLRHIFNNELFDGKLRRDHTKRDQDCTNGLNSFNRVCRN